MIKEKLSNQSCWYVIQGLFNVGTLQEESLMGDAKFA